MNIFKILFLSFIITSFTASAQMNNINNMNNRVLGNQNNMMQNSGPTEPSPAEIEKRKNERIVEFMNKLKTAINLDDLQYIAIKNDIISTGKRIDIVLKSTNSDENKEKEIRASEENREKNINSYLNADQRVQYKTFLQDLNSNKTAKKKKKNKDEEKEKVVNE